MCYSTTKELWDNVNQMYSDLEIESRVFELNLKLGDVRQRGNTVTRYFHKLSGIWQELDLFDNYDWELTKDQMHYKKVVEDNHIYKFIIGRNDEFNDVRSRVTNRKPSHLLMKFS